MARIAFFLLPRRSHIDTSLPLARKLTLAGQRIFYLGSDETSVNSPGIEYRTLLDRRFSASGISHTLNDDQQTWWISEAPTKALEQLNLDLLVVDSFFPYAAFVAQRLKIPVVSLSMTMPQGRAGDLPPLTSLLLPGQDPLTRQKIAMSWWTLKSRQRYQARRSSQADPATRFIELARHYGYSRQSIDFETEFLPRLDIPEIVLCPQAFDFPRPTLTTRHYIEPTIDLSGSEPSFPWEKLNPDLPLIYTDLSNPENAFNQQRQAIECVVEAMRLVPQWQAVVQIGVQLEAGSINIRSKNVLLVQVAPQLRLFRQARLAITDGDLQNIKTCIYFGLPLVCLPFDGDQPGNSARVVYHGLGSRLSSRELSPEALLNQMGVVFHNLAIKDRMGQMKQIFRQAEEDNLSVEEIIRYVAAPAR